MWVLKVKPGSPAEAVFLTAKPSLQTQMILFLLHSEKMDSKDLGVKEKRDGLNKLFLFI